jgi:hypothetical protein
MTARTEQHPPGLSSDLAREGRKGMPTEGTA